MNQRGDALLVENLLIRKMPGGSVSLTWTSESESTRSWVFVNGKFLLGPFIGDAKGRTIVLSLPESETYVVEVHDFVDDTVPEPIEEKPLTRPQISWNAVDDAMYYRIYHTIFDHGSMETVLCEVPPLSGRNEIDCPILLEGKNGRWHSFRVEAVDQFGNESHGEVIPHYASDLPPKPELAITRDTATGLLTFQILTKENTQ